MISSHASVSGPPDTNLLVLVGQVVAAEIVEGGDLTNTAGEILGASSWGKNFRVTSNLGDLNK